MKIVLDTNVIVSGLLSSKGPPARIFQLWKENKVEVVISEDMLFELERVLDYKRVRQYLSLTEQEKKLFLRRFRNKAVVIDPDMKLSIVVDDEDDNRVLECAVESKSNVIVTGDRHLLNLKRFKAIEILTPAEFVRLMES